MCIRDRDETFQCFHYFQVLNHDLGCCDLGLENGGNTERHDEVRVNIV